MNSRHLSVSPNSQLCASPFSNRCCGGLCMPVLGGHGVPGAVVVEDDDYGVDIKGLAVLGDPIVGE